MRSRFKLNAIIVSIAAVTALTLTVVRRTPQGIVSFSIEPPEVRASPGEKAGTTPYDLSALAIYNRTLLYIKQNYVDSSRLDPEKMLFQSLDSVQFNIPEVLVEPNLDAHEVTVSVNDQTETYSTDDVVSPWKLGHKLSKVFRFIEKNMNAGAELAQVEYAAVNGMLATLDPHSNLMDPESAREMDVSTSGKFGGLGIVIRMIDKKLTVVRPMKDTPASKKGILSNDHIVKIDGESTENLTLNEAVDRMRGDPGTPVTLYIEREGENKTLRVDLVRDVIRVESVVSKLLDQDVGYIKIKQFSSSTGAEVEAALDALGKSGAEGWVLDLRGNPGGLLEQAITVTDLFVDTGTIVTTVSGKEREPRRAEKGDGDASSPLIVLVNGGSASASEIVAGALKNLDRALIVGSRTFGKGSVQVLYDNDDGSKLKLTVAEYLTPGDRSIQSVGVVPDVALQRMYVPDKNDAIGDWVRLLAPTHQWGERDLDAAIVSAYARDTDTSSYELPFLYERPGKKKPANGPDAMPGEDEDPEELYEDVDEDEVVEDFEIKLGKELASTLTGSTRTAMVKSAKSLIAKKRAEQETKLIAALSTLDVDWTEAPKTQDRAPMLTAKIEVTPSTELRAGDDVTLTGTVTNTGTGPAWRVHGRVAADDNLFEDTELVFGKVDPGETKTFSARLRVPKDAVDRIDLLSFGFTEGRGQAVAADPVELKIAAAKRPVFAYAYHLIDGGNGDGLVQTQETHTLRVTVKNAGDGDSAETTAVLRNASGDGISVDKSRFELGKLAPGDSQVVDFPFEITDKLEGDAVVELMLWDNVLGATASEKLKFPVAKAITVTAASGTIEVKKRVELRQGASDDAPVIGFAKKDARFKTLGTANGYTKIQVEPGRTAFVASGKVGKTSSSASGGFELSWQVTPPEIALTSPVYETTAATYDLSGKVTDEIHVEDVYIYVSNSSAKIDGRKVFYASNRSGKTKDALAFTAELPLWPGSNNITVIARESVNVRAISSFYIYRGKGAKTASAP